MWTKCILLCIVLFLHGQYQRTRAYKIRTEEDVLEYLKHFGYLPEDGREQVAAEEVEDAIMDFQEDSDLTPTGELTLKTLHVMNAPRCGNRDERVEEGDEIDGSVAANGLRRRRRKRFIIPAGKKWNKTTLTYKIHSFPTRTSRKLDVRAVQSEFDAAFSYWQRVTNLKFKKTNGTKADIVIKFVRGYHGDRESFDGPGRTIAHGFYPEKGAIHFDDEDGWSVGYKQWYFDIRAIAVHEIGHALGLGHVSNKFAVMFHSYAGHRGQNHDNFSLHSDDIQAVQALYGERKGKAGSKDGSKDGSKGGKKKQKSKKSMTGDLCVDPHIDAITTMEDGFIYIFKGPYFFRLDRLHGNMPGDRYHLINSTFEGLPSHLDAVLTMSNQKTYFFKDALYWRSSSTNIDPGYPKKIKDHFHKIPNSIDAACIWSWNGEPYFFKGEKYWKYSDVRREMRNYPNPIGKYWPGIPNSIDAAFRAPDNRTYFIKNNKYWMFHDPNSLEEATVFPKLTKNWLFKCPNNDVRKVRARGTRHKRKRLNSL